MTDRGSRPRRRLVAGRVLRFVVFALVGAGARSAAASDGFCDAWLAHVSDHAAARGYLLTPTEGGLTGLDGQQNALQAGCAAERAVMTFTGPDATVDVTWTATGLVVRGEFLGLGRVEQRWSGVESEQRLRHTAEHDAAAACVEFDPSTGGWSVEGDPDLLNADFAPVLAGSAPWRDAYFVIHAVTGVWDSGLQRDEEALEVASSLALPPNVCHDVDKGGVKKDCGATLGICAVAYFWKPLTGACVAAGAKCLAAFKCWKSDCSGDGKS
ncbi:hypothetical protein [Nannocystis bainbridge]|uniref:Uncharacterized protein n=1 Tax=Nannocystis bainbridge TaxID=2995303 RepID=A0ABT5E5I4_9BACT|nr:hypothetical protein [Nannocystis bainbridge]MDC0720975.1 hypothetical protein [Nannocystis bainbridge]